MTRVRRRDYSKLTRNIKRIPTCFRHVCSNDRWESLQQRNKTGCFQASNNNEQVTGGALRARCLNGAKFYIKLTSPAHSVWKGGPTVFRCDGAYMRRRHEVPGMVRRGGGR
jgi:hypothetical protein